MTSEAISPKLLAAQSAVMQLVRDGAPDRVVEAGRNVCRCYRQGLPLDELDKFTLEQYARRRQSQNRYGQ